MSLSWTTKNPTFPETMATGLLHRSLLFSSALATRSQVREHASTHATALPRPFQHIAAALAAPTTALTLHTNTSKTHLGPPTAPLVLTHGAPHPQILEPAHPERDSEAVQPNFTSAARAHNQPHHPGSPASSIHAHTTIHAATHTNAPHRPRTHSHTQTTHTNSSATPPPAQNPAITTAATRSTARSQHNTRDTDARPLNTSTPPHDPPSRAPSIAQHNRA